MNTKTTSLTVAIAALIVFVSFTVIKNGITNDDITNDSLLWTKQLQFAQKNASLVDKQAVLVRVFVNIMPLDDESKPLMRIRMLFVDSSNKYINVEYQYESQEKTFNMDTAYGDNVPERDKLNESQRMGVTTAFSSVRATPKGALYTGIQKIGLSKKDINNLDFVEAVLELEYSNENAYEKIPVWKIVYDTGKQRFKIWINAKDGKLIKQDLS